MPTAHVVFGTALPVQRRSRKARNAFPCLPLPRALSPAPSWGYSCPPALTRHSCTCAWRPARPWGFSPSFGTMFRYVTEVVDQLCGTASASTHSMFPVSQSQVLFVPSPSARLKSSYHRQRERNILQVCNSLKHWTCSNMSLLSGRKEGRHVQTVVYSNTPVEFGSISTD